MVNISLSAIAEQGHYKIIKTGRGGSSKAQCCGCARKHTKVPSLQITVKCFCEAELDRKGHNWTFIHQTSNQSPCSRRLTASVLSDEAEQSTPASLRSRSIPVWKALLRLTGNPGTSAYPTSKPPRKVWARSRWQSPTGLCVNQP